MAEPGLDGARFEIGAVISRAFETISRNLVLFCGLALLLAGIPQFALEWWRGGVVEAQAPFGPAYSGGSTFWGMFIVAWLVSVVTSAILQAALTRATVQSLSGETPQFGRCLTVGLTLAVPMIVIGLLFGIAVGIGLLLLVVPGIILALVWSVVIPVYVQEKVGIFEAFGRSAQLTSGSRFRIFLTLLIVVVLIWVLLLVLGIATAIVAAMGSIILIALFSAVLGALGSMIMVAIQASIYVELRQLKDGIAPADLEAIFA